MSHKPKVAKLDGLAKLPHLTVHNGLYALDFLFLRRYLALMLIVLAQTW